MAHILTKALKYSPNGFEVITYEAGEQKELPDGAVQAAEAQGILETAKKSPAKKSPAKKAESKSDEG